MPPIRVVIFREDDGSAPVMDWLDALPPKAQDKCIVRIERLKQHGYELRRPDADTLRDGIHELRTRLGAVNYRILYFFHGGCAVLSHGLVKEREVPDREIDLAVSRKQRFARNPQGHTHEE